MATWLEEFKVHGRPFDQDGWRFEGGALKRPPLRLRIKTMLEDELRGAMQAYREAPDVERDHYATRIGTIQHIQNRVEELQR